MILPIFEQGRRGSRLETKLRLEVHSLTNNFFTKSIYQSTLLEIWWGVYYIYYLYHLLLYVPENWRPPQQKTGAPPSKNWRGSKIVLAFCWMACMLLIVLWLLVQLPSVPSGILAQVPLGYLWIIPFIAISR
jgi:hypothetical protein